MKRNYGRLIFTLLYYPLLPDNEDEEDDMSLERRLTGMPVGLKNLGNTCYVNSFLQIWFHNVPFREALYKWDPGHDPLESENETLLEAEHYRPKGKVARYEMSSESTNHKQTSFFSRQSKLRISFMSKQTFFFIFVIL